MIAASRVWSRDERVLGVLLGVCLTASGACAPRLVSLPRGPGAPLADGASRLARATTACAGVKSLSVELSLAGQATGRNVRGRVLAGFAQPDRLRLEGVAPFGPPIFILASRDGRATLLLPRDDRVLRDASVAEVVDALTGIRLEPDQLAALITGCATPSRVVTRAEQFDRDWVVFGLESGAAIYTRSGTIVAARLDDLRVDYQEVAAGFPRRVRLSRIGGGAGNRVDLSVAVSQLSTNVALPDEAFQLIVPPDALPLSLDEVRRVLPAARP